MRPGDLDDIVDLAEDPGSSRALASSRHPPEREPPAKRAYIGKPPPGWKKPTRFIIGKRPLSKCAEHVKRMRSPVFVNKSREQITQPRDYPLISQETTTTLREQSYEILVEEGEGPSSSHTSSRTLANSGSSRPLKSSLHRPQPRLIPRYAPPCQETIEDADLVVHDETHKSNSRTKDIPVRILRDFSVYDLTTKQLVNFEELQFDLRRDPPKLDYGASGFVEVCIDEDENVDDELDEDENTLLSSPSTAAPLRVALSPIIGISTHHVGDDAAAGSKLNEQIYLLTEFAWYILVEPNAQYVALYASLYVKHRLFHELVVASLAAVAQHQTLLLEDFKEILDAMDMSGTSQPELCITKDYLNCSEVLEYLAGNFKDLCAESPDFARPIRKVPAIHDITKLSYQSAPKPLTRTFDAVQAEMTRRDSKTTVTPRVYELAKRIFFQNHLERIPMEDDYTMKSTPQMMSTLRSHNHARVGCWWVKGSELSSGGYQSVIIDGIQYNVGDTVLVGQGSDEDKRREKRARALAIGDQLSDKYWFVKICSMFEDRNRTTKLVIPSFHGQWYYHGSKSVLHDLAHPRQLFPTDECHDNPLDIIVQKCNVVELKGTPEPPEEGKEIKDFFSGIFWDQTRTAFCEISHEEYHEAPNASQPGPGEGCTSCSLRHVRLEREAWHVEDAGKRLRLGGVDFHIHDFIYLRPDAPAPALYLIGQIIAKVDIHVKTGKSFMVKVRVYERYDAVVNKDLEDEKKDERSLVFTDCIRTFDISRIEGKAYAVHVESLKPQDRDEWASHDDHFLVRQKAVVYPPTNTSHLRPLRRKDFRCCQECHADRLEVLREQDALLAQHGPLQCLELFAGAGGLATGLHQSGFVKTKWAIELAPSAALSFAANNPDCTVYNQCTNVMLQHVVDIHCGRKPKPVFSRNPMERGPLPPMPKPGEVDFISGGPPCQSFSGANHLKRIDDIRTTLVSNMISYVEFYRPKYFLLENVIGMLSHRLGQKRDGVGETGMTIVKFIFRSLIALGYQVHCKVLQAAQYGAPQGRERVIFWGARRDVPLPDFPYPTHHYKPGSKTYDLLTGEALHRPVRLMPSNLNTKERDEYRQYAPFQAVTIQDAIGDLRKFDWISPHNIIEPRRHHDVERKGREARGIVSYSAVVDRGISASYSGSSRDESYLHPPLNRYQMQVRQGLTLNAGVKYHYTNRYSAKVVERVVNVPLRSGANHTNLPPPLRDDRKFETGNTSKRAYALHYGRLDKHGQFRTTITTVKPNTMNGCVLHPTQKRVLTVRECARAQGFPDSYVFESTQKVSGKIVEDQLRQIGNAVPVPLALALGKELGKALIKMWTRKQKEPERELSPEVPMEVESEVESE